MRKLRYLIHIKIILTLGIFLNCETALTEGIFTGTNNNVRKLFVFRDRIQSMRCSLYIILF